MPTHQQFNTSDDTRPRFDYDALKGRAAAVKARIDPVAFFDHELKHEGKRVGGVYQWYSPWREERTPSFTVDPNGRYIDYGESDEQKQHGDIIQFVRIQHNMSFPEAVAYLESY